MKQTLEIYDDGEEILITGDLTGLKPILHHRIFILINLYVTSFQ